MDAASEHNPCHRRYRRRRQIRHLQHRRGGRQRRYVFVKLVISAALWNMIRRKLSILAAGKNFFIL